MYWSIILDEYWVIIYCPITLPHIASECLPSQVGLSLNLWVIATIDCVLVVLGIWEEWVVDHRLIFPVSQQLQLVIIGDSNFLWVWVCGEDFGTILGCQSSCTRLWSYGYKCMVDHLGLRNCTCLQLRVWDYVQYFRPGSRSGNRSIIMLPSSRWVQYPSGQGI